MQRAVRGTYMTYGTNGDFQPDLLGQRKLIGLVRRDGIARRVVDPKSVKRLVKPLESGGRLRERETLVRGVHPLRQPERLRTPPPHRTDRAEVERPAAAVPSAVGRPRTPWTGPAASESD
jgi:hypothetical protein